eukprot:m.440243 g.440243  ORF g.440243 m.440243 type:complete len:265 (+) comp18490_c0_seq1:114-908(+)
MAVNGLTSAEVLALCEHLKDIKVVGSPEQLTKHKDFISRLTELAEKPIIPRASSWSAPGDAGNRLRKYELPYLLQRNSLSHENTDTTFDATEIFKKDEDADKLEKVKACDRYEIKKALGKNFCQLLEKDVVVFVKAVLGEFVAVETVDASVGTTFCDITVQMGPNVLLMVEVKNADKLGTPKDQIEDGKVFAQLLVYIVATRSTLANTTIFGCATNGTFWRFLKVLPPSDGITSIPSSVMLNVDDHGEEVVAYLKTIALWGAKK